METLFGAYFFERMFWVPYLKLNAVDTEVFRDPIRGASTYTAPLRRQPEQTAIIGVHG